MKLKLSAWPLAATALLLSACASAPNPNAAPSAATGVYFQSPLDGSWNPGPNRRV